MGYRIASKGPVYLAGAPVADASEWSVDVDAKLEDVPNLTRAVETNVPVNYGWDGSIKLEYALTPLGLGSGIGFGNWNGVDVAEWEFSAEADIEECTGAADLWRVHQYVQMKWDASASKWQATDHFKLFVQMLQAQGLSNQPVSFRSPFADGAAYLEKGEFAADGKPQKNKLSLKPAAGAFTPKNQWVAAIHQAAVSILQSGYAPPVAVRLHYATGLPFLQGDALIKKVSFTCPVGNVTGTIEFQGTGAPQLL